ncbi:mucin-2, partial [Helicoverpa armigera]|uniref:mucin-2 n=1 Tax=Helicoverpa armigera TaxID=29058 RepID=UPI00308329B7
MKALVNLLKKPINLPNCGTDDVWLLPDPRDCSSYYYCISGQIDSVSCCCGYEFSPEQLVCLPKEQARCRTSYFPECQEYDVWSLPNPSSCTNFYWCNKGQVIKVNCPYLNEFSPTELECLPKDQAGCSITPTTRHPDTPTPSTIPSCGFYDYWVQGDPSDCSKYLICSQGKIEKYECCCDYEFSPIQMVCIPKEQAGCSGLPYPACGYNDNWALPSPDSCADFYLCNQGQIVTVTCPYHYEFSPSALECLPKEIAGCSPTTTPPVTRTTVVSTTVATTTVDPDSTCTNTSLWVHPHPENCQLYLICFYGDLTIEKCGETTLFDPVSMECRPQEQVNCHVSTKTPSTTVTTPSPTTTTVSPTTTTLSPPTTTPIVCNSYEIRLIKDETDCRHFILCLYGKMSRELCANNMEFNPIHHVCEPAEEAGCSISPPTTVLPTTSTTTVTPPTTTSTTTVTPPTTTSSTTVTPPTTTSSTTVTPPTTTSSTTVTPPTTTTSSTTVTSPTTTSSTTVTPPTTTSSTTVTPPTTTSSTTVTPPTTTSSTTVTSPTTTSSTTVTSPTTTSSTTVTSPTTTSSTTVSPPTTTGPTTVTPSSKTPPTGPTTKAPPTGPTTKAPPTGPT